MQYTVLQLYHCCWKSRHISSSPFFQARNWSIKSNINLNSNKFFKSNDSFFIYLLLKDYIHMWVRENLRKHIFCSINDQKRGYRQQKDCRLIKIINCNSFLHNFVKLSSTMLLLIWYQRLRNKICMVEGGRSWFEVVKLILLQDFIWFHNRNAV